MASAGEVKLGNANQVIDNNDQCQSETGENDVPAPAIPANKMATANRSRENSCYRPYRVYWSPVDEEFFISLMIRQVKDGNMNPRRFNSNTWNYIKNRLNNARGRNFSLDAVKGKYYRLKRNWQEFKTLLDFSSKFVWEPKANVVIALEDVWEHYLQEYPRNKRFRKNGCKYYTLLTKIFGDSAEGGHFGRSFADTQSLSNQEDYSSHSLEIISEMGIKSLMERIETLKLWTKYFNARTKRSYNALKNGFKLASDRSHESIIDTFDEHIKKHRCVVASHQWHHEETRKHIRSMNDYCVAWLADHSIVSKNLRCFFAEAVA